MWDISGNSWSPGRRVTLQRQTRETQAPLLFLFCSLKFPPNNPRMASQAVWAVFVFRGLNSPPCLGRDLQELPDRRNYIQQRRQWQKLIKTQIRLQDERGGSVVREDQGRGKRGRDRKNRERGRDREIAISTRPAGVCPDTNLCASRKGQWRRGHPVHCSRGEQARKPAWGPSSLGLSRVCTQVCGNLLLGPVPKGTSLGGRETKVWILGWLDFEPRADICMPITHEINLPSGEPLHFCLSPVRWALGQRGQVSQAGRSDVVAAWCPLSRKDKTRRGHRGEESIAQMRILRPPGPGRQTYHLRWRWNEIQVRAGHREASFRGLGRAKILSWEVGNCP